MSVTQLTEGKVCKGGQNPPLVAGQRPPAPGGSGSKSSITVPRAELFRLLHEYGPCVNASGNPVEHIKPGHGPCCTCQTCGYMHDECCCLHNEFVAELEKVAQ